MSMHNVRFVCRTVDQKTYKLVFETDPEMSSVWCTSRLNFESYSEIEMRLDKIGTRLGAWHYMSSKELARVGFHDLPFDTTFALEKW
jgi:hypothetical protein